MNPKIAILGGGITGLAAAHRVHELLPKCELALYEATGRLGGVLQTLDIDGYLVERSADSFITKQPAAFNLCQRLGIEDQLIPTNSANRRALVLHQGQLHRLPEGFVLMSPRNIGAVLRSPILSLGGKLRLCCEPFIPRGKHVLQNDVSVAEFVGRRLGRQALERLVQPLLAGIYTADAKRLSMAATMPQFIDQLRQHGSLLRAAQKEANASGRQTESAARYGMFVAPRQGMGSLVEEITSRLPEDSVSLNTRVTQVERKDTAGWQITLAGHDALETFDAVIIALPRHVTAELIAKTESHLAGALRTIEYASSAVVSFGIQKGDVAHLLDAFGVVVPAIEGRGLIAASFASIKFPGRAPDGHVLIRAFVGGALHPELLQQPDEKIVELAQEELSQMLGFKSEPKLLNLARWERAMPQYHVGHLDRVATIERLVAELPGLEMAGSGFRGVGIPQCIESAESAAERVVELFAEESKKNGATSA